MFNPLKIGVFQMTNVIELSTKTKYIKFYNFNWLTLTTTTTTKIVLRLQQQYIEGGTKVVREKRVSNYVIQDKKRQEFQTIIIRAIDTFDMQNLIWIWVSYGCELMNWTGELSGK